MGNFAAKNKDWLKTLDPTGKLYDLVGSIENEINAQKSQTGAAGILQTGQAAPTPPAPAKLNVQAAGGIFQVNITDQTPGVNYVLEYSPTVGSLQQSAPDTARSRGDAVPRQSRQPGAALARAFGLPDRAALGTAFPLPLISARPFNRHR